MWERRRNLLRPQGEGNIAAETQKKQQTGQEEKHFQQKEQEVQRPWGGEGRGVLPAQACVPGPVRGWCGWGGASGKMEGDEGGEAGKTDPKGHSHSGVRMLRF